MSECYILLNLFLIIFFFKSNVIVWLSLCFTTVINFESKNNKVLFYLGFTARQDYFTHF